MKKIIVFAALLSVIACKKGDSKESEPGIMDAVEGVKNINKASDAIKDFKKKAEELKKMKPISNEVFKQILTENLGNLKRTNFSTGATAAMGLTTGEATYSDDANKSVKITIFDGAGETGSAILAMTNIALAMDAESIQNTSTKKNEEIDGIKCITENDTNPNNMRSNITYIYKERFQVTMDGQNMSLDELKTFMDKLDLSKLE